MNASLATRIDLNLLNWNALDEKGQRAALRRATQDSAAAVRLGVGKIIARVLIEVDAALRKYSRLLDRAALDDFAVGQAEFDAAEASLDRISIATATAAGSPDSSSRPAGSRACWMLT